MIKKSVWYMFGNLYNSWVLNPNWPVLSDEQMSVPDIHFPY